MSTAIKHAYLKVLQGGMKHINMFRFALAALVTVFASLPVFAANIYYASPSGTSTDCTMQSPGSLKQALAKVQGGTSWADGDTVILLDSDSTYNISDAKEMSITAAFLTIKSENGNPDKAVIYRNGNSQRCFNVSASVKFEGLTIKNFYLDTEGAAIYVGAIGESDSVIIDNCKFIQNKANKLTAGVYSSSLNNDVTVKNSYFEGNTATSGSCAYNIKKIENCTFTGNTAPGNGLVTYSSNVYDSKFYKNTGNVKSTIGVVYGGSATRCEFIDNTAIKSGGAVAYCAATNCLIKGNSATHGAASIGNCSLYGCRIEGNSATYGICFEGGAMNIINCLIIGNSLSATKHNSRDVFENCTLYNCTIVDNSISFAGGIMYNSGCAYNCIFRGNKPYDLRYVNTTIRAENCIYESALSYPTSATIYNEDPLFVTPSEKDPEYSLQRKSPAVNKGIDYGIFAASDYDITGKKLRLNGIVDLGCYEYWPQSGFKIIIR